MPLTRKLVSDTLLGILGDPTAGFNAQFMAIAGAYSIDNPFEIDWGAGSANFAQVYIAPEQIDYADLIPADGGTCVLLYTSTSVTNSGEERQKPSIFSGRIMAHVDFLLRRKTLRLLRQGVNLPSDSGGNLENLANAIEDAFLSTVMARSAEWSPVNFNGDFQCAREPFVYTGDGWQARIPFQLVCEVNV